MLNSFSATIILSSFLVGGLLNLPVSLFPTWKRLFGWSDKQFFIVQWIFYLSLAVLLVASGLVVNVWGSFETILFGSLIAAFGLAALAVNVPVNVRLPGTPPAPETPAAADPLAPAPVPPSRRFSVVLSSLILLAAATALLHTATAVAMPAAFFPQAADIHETETKVPAATNLGYVFVGLGFLLMPVLKKLLLESWSDRSGLLVVALLFLAPAVTAMVAGKDVFPSRENDHDFAGVFSSVRVWMTVVAVLFLYALESAQTHWSSVYLDDLGFTPRGKATLWVFFWGLFFAARLMTSLFVGLLAFSWVLALATLLIAILIGNMVGMTQKSTGGVAFLLLGFCLGPIFPTAAGLILFKFPSQMALAFGVICGSATLGRILFQPVIERQVQTDRLRFAMGLTMIMALLVAIPALVLLVM